MNRSGPGQLPAQLSIGNREALYLRALPARRNGSLYGAFPYPAKISPEAIALFIAAHTNPGDTVFDGFSGSGTTGVATLLCEDPSPSLRAEAERLGLDAQWGPRNAVLYELSAVGAFVGRTLTNPPDPQEFRKAAEETLHFAEGEFGWMYAATDPEGRSGKIRHIVWSDVLQCPICRAESTLWDACVSLDPASISSQFNCPHCSFEASLKSVERLPEESHDCFIGKNRTVRLRQIARVYGTTDSQSWSRNPVERDVSLVDSIDQESIPDSVPRATIPWGDLYRRGYHAGITHLHHLYTKRNLIVFGRLWKHAALYDAAICDALRFWLLSYNASHATVMTRVVAKTGRRDLTPTSAQPGVLYVSGLPVEKNLILGLRRKLSTIFNAFEATYGRKGVVKVIHESSCRVHLPDGTVDYAFTDPPFGGNIPYAEVNFINEAWLGRQTDRAEEIVVSNAQNKTVADYQRLLTNALSEVCRILKPAGMTTLVFHSSSAGIWNALQAAYTDAGFGLECAGILDKKQGSFKQITTTGAVRGDPILLLRKMAPKSIEASSSVWAIAEMLLQTAIRSNDPSEWSADRLYSRLVGYFLERQEPIPLDAESFYCWYRERDASELRDGSPL